MVEMPDHRMPAVFGFGVVVVRSALPYSLCDAGSTAHGWSTVWRCPVSEFARCVSAGSWPGLCWPFGEHPGHAAGLAPDYGIQLKSMELTQPNDRAALDEAIAFCLHFGGHRRASEPERYAE